VGNHVAERARTRDRWPPLRERSPPELRSVPNFRWRWITTSWNNIRRWATYEKKREEGFCCFLSSVLRPITIGPKGHAFSQLGFSQKKKYSPLGPTGLHIASTLAFFSLWWSQYPPPCASWFPFCDLCASYPCSNVCLLQYCSTKWCKSSIQHEALDQPSTRYNNSTVTCSAVINFTLLVLLYWENGSASTNDDTKP
jgi:hypothetical protein